MLKKLFLISVVSFLFFVLSQIPALAQGGIRFPEFSKKLEMYFHPDLISDIAKEMPANNDFTVWGWDVGDVSDDGNNDVAFCIRRSGTKDKIVDVYIFVDIDGFLVKVGQFKYSFVELPLEVGAAFRYGILYITQKFKQFDWKIEGYKFVNGSLLNYDDYFTSRKGKLTHEIYKNYYTLQNTEKYLNTASGKTEFFADYLAIPSYSRGRLIYKGITDAAFSNYIDYVPAGAYWWSGDEDLSFSASSVYDEQFLYFTINVTDSSVAKPFTETMRGEEIELWLDVNNYNSSYNRERTKAKADENTRNRFTNAENEKAKADVEFKEGVTTGLYKFGISLGDFVNKEPTMTMNSTDELTSVQKVAALNLNVVADLTEKGYYLMFKIPFSALGKTGAPISENENEIIEWGCTIRVIDIDNEFRPERFTILQTSLFNEESPVSYGSLLFMPDETWYGETYNIYRDKIVQSIEEFGY